jgi:pilus assembly protein CpaF
MSLWERTQSAAASATAFAVDVEPADGGGDPLAALVADATIDEILVNGPDEVWIERHGRLQRAAARFADREALRDACVRLVARAGRRLDDAEPMVDARLADGSRLNAVLPPLAPDGPLLTMRRFSPRPFSLAGLVERGTLDPSCASLLAACVAARLNVVIAGGTSSGKTATLGALAALVDAGERIVTVEDAAELRIDRPHVVRLEARPANLEGRGAVTIRELVRNALRMRPDRLVVGEVRGGEALDMLQAMNTGHDGSLTTVHANGPGDALRRIETMALMSGLDLPHAAIREQVATAVDVVVQQQRAADGLRTISAVRAVERDGRGWRLADEAAVLARCARGRSGSDVE